MSQSAKKRLFFLLRWGIAVGGITWVVMNLHLRDRVLAILDESNLPVLVPLAEPVGEDAQHFPVVDPSGDVQQIPRDRVVNRPDQKFVTIYSERGEQKVELLGLDLTPDLRSVRRLLVANPQTRQGEWVSPALAPAYSLRVPHPRKEVGIRSMLREADGTLLIAAVLVFPATFLLTSYRWNQLLKALEIRIGQARVFVINMVGAFYNTFMPGSTGGDLLKAYYVAKHTTLRTRAVMSVIVDRIIGLMALVILGGVMALYQFHIPACRKVALMSAVVIGSVSLALFIFYHPFLRKITGLDYILNRLPMQRQVQKAVETMEIYRRRPMLVVWTLLVTFPVHMTVIVSATFAGMAFDLPLHPLYYWAVVPVIVLVGAIPISPQGAGVMEFFAIALTRGQGVTIGQAFVLTMSIRLVQITWNLVGGLFVLRGGYHAPPQAEIDRMQGDSPPGPAPLPAAGGGS